MLLYFNHLHPSAPAKRPEKSGPSCYNADRKSSGTSTSAVAQRQKQSCRRRAGNNKRGTTKVAKVGKPEVARVSRRAVSPFVCLARGHRISRATYRCKMSLQHGQRYQRRCRPSRSDGANTREFNEIAPGMWGVLTRARPAPSTQTIENKRTILRHRPRTPRKTEIYQYMRHSATFHKGHLCHETTAPFVSMTLEAVEIGSVGTAMTGGSHPRNVETPGRGRKTAVTCSALQRLEPVGDHGEARGGGFFR